MTATLIGAEALQEWRNEPACVPGVEKSLLARLRGRWRRKTAKDTVSRSPAAYGRLTQRYECVPYKDEVGGSNPSSPTRAGREKAAVPGQREWPCAGMQAHGRTGPSSRRSPGRGLARAHTRGPARAGQLAQAAPRPAPPPPPLPPVRGRRLRGVDDARGPAGGAALVAGDGARRARDAGAPVGVGLRDEERGPRDRRTLRLRAPPAVRRERSHLRRLLRGLGAVVERARRARDPARLLSAHDPLR